MKKQLSKEAYKKRLNDIRNVRKEMTKRDIDSLHVKLQRGNSKTGANCYTVSLLPVIDCANCKQCSRDCYDVKSDMIYKTVKEDRARNSVIHEKDPRRFWREIGLQIQANFVESLRLNVGGDHEISAGAASWCELATVGEIYEFREGEIEIMDIP